MPYFSYVAIFLLDVFSCGPLAFAGTIKYAPALHFVEWQLSAYTIPQE